MSQLSQKPGEVQFSVSNRRQGGTTQSLRKVETILREPPGNKRGDTGTGTKVNVETEEVSFLAEEIAKIQPEGRESRARRKNRMKLVGF